MRSERFSTLVTAVSFKTDTQVWDKLLIMPLKHLCSSGTVCEACNVEDNVCIYILVKWEQNTADQHPISFIAGGSNVTMQGQQKALLFPIKARYNIAIYPL